LSDTNDDTIDVMARKTQLVQNFSRFVELTPHLPNELQTVVINIKKPGPFKALNRLITLIRKLEKASVAISSRWSSRSRKT